MLGMKQGDVLHQPGRESGSLQQLIKLQDGGSLPRFLGVLYEEFFF
jgi:hypothetical protein